ncbi:MAG: hypothetical protein SNJ70_07275 [Armatimonadota bacterium]
MSISSLSKADDTIKAMWINIDPNDTTFHTSIVYRKTFEVNMDVEKAVLKYTCITPMDYKGTEFTGYINGAKCASGTFWMDAQYTDISKAINYGINYLEIEVTRDKMGSIGPVLVKLEIQGKNANGKQINQTIYSDSTWK